MNLYFIIFKYLYNKITLLNNFVNKKLLKVNINRIGFNIDMEIVKKNNYMRQTTKIISYTLII